MKKSVWLALANANEQECEEEAEQRKDADRPQDRAKVDLACAKDDPAQDGEGGDRQEDRVGAEGEPDQPLRGHGLRDQRGDDGEDGDGDGKAYPRRAHVGAREPDHSSQAGNRDCRYPPAPALGRQGHHHREGDEDQEEDKAVSLADPLDELQAGLAGVAQTAKSAARVCGLVRHPSTFGRARAAPSLAPRLPTVSDRLDT